MDIHASVVVHLAKFFALGELGNPSFRLVRFHDRFLHIFSGAASTATPASPASSSGDARK
jgi:hypothetical protein